jgi:hypothetical protein
VLDELGYLPFAQSGGPLLFHLVSCSATLNLTGQRQDCLHPIVEQAACRQGLVKPLAAAGGGLKGQA